jgi:hypothetical protein
MKLHTLNEQINHQVGILFSRLYYTLNTNLKKEGLPDHEIENFTIFDRVREDIEKELVKLTLTTPYVSDAFDHNDLLHFESSDINIVRDKIYDKYAFLCSPRTEFFARKCDLTGTLMNEGWVVYDNTYIASEFVLANFLRHISEEPEVDKELSDMELRNKYYSIGAHYYTEWHIPTQIAFAKLDGTTYRINH